MEGFQEELLLFEGTAVPLSLLSGKSEAWLCQAGIPVLAPFSIHAPTQDVFSFLYWCYFPIPIPSLVEILFFYAGDMQIFRYPKKTFFPKFDFFQASSKQNPVNSPAFFFPG